MSANLAARRRQFLGAGAAWGGLALAGCVTAPAGGVRSTAQAKGRVVVVGGGFGGATAARYLRLWGGAGVEVTLVERETAFVSCPMSNLVLAGTRSLASITHSYDSLRAAGVKVITDEVMGIDGTAKTVRLAGGGTLPYDRLVVSPGVGFITDGISGLPAALASGRVLHAWKAGPQTSALRQQLLAMPEGGVVAITIPKAPYRCPPGPYERACLIAAFLKAAKPRAKLLVLDANPEITSKKALFERAFKEHYAGLVEYRPNNDLQGVEVAGNQLVAKLEFDDVKADVLNVIPPQRGGDLARSAGLLNLNARWAGVNWQTMESTAMPDVHVLGDAVFAAPAMPKSGHMANQHAKVAAAAILQLLQGQAVNATPVMANTCYSFVTPEQAVHVASVHQWDAAEKTLKPVPGAGGLSTAASVAEGRYATSWADNIWADALAQP